MTDYELSHVSRRAPTPKKRGKTPEAKVTAECDRYLKSIGVLVIRANAGSWADDQGNIIMGAKAGTSDKVLCVPGGLFAALELKSAAGKQTEAQKAYQARVEALGATYILARSVAELRAALCAAYGPQRVSEWETAGRQRLAAKKAELAALKRRNGQ